MWIISIIAFLLGLYLGFQLGFKWCLSGVKNMVENKTLKINRDNLDAN